MDERSRNIAVGLTALVGLVGLLGMMLLFGYVPQWLQGGYEIHVRLPYSAGLHESSRVYLSGIDVGEVKQVRLVRPPGQGVVATARINEEVRIPRESRVTVESKLLGGTPSLAFNPIDTPDGPQAYLDPGETIQGSIPSLTSTLSQELELVLEEPMAEFRRITDAIEQLSTEWTRVGEQVNQVLEPRPLDDVEAGAAEPNLTSVMTRLDRRLIELEQTIQGVNSYLDDDQLREDIQVAASNTRQLTEQMQQAVTEVRESVTVDVQALRNRYIALADDMSGTVNAFQQLAQDARNGEGTLGRLVQDPALYQNLNDTAQRLQQAVDEMRLLIEKWKSEGLPVQF